MDELAIAARDKCAIAGIGVTEFMKDSRRSVLSLATPYSKRIFSTPLTSGCEV